MADAITTAAAAADPASGVVGAVRDRFETVRPYLMPALGLALFAAAIWAINNELGQWRLEDIAAALRGLPAGAVAVSVAASALGYLILGLYDVMALRYLERPLPVRRTLLAGFVGYAFSHTMGMPLLTGGAVRYRLYSAWGLSAADIAGIVAFNSATLWLGLGAMFVIGGLAGPEELGRLIGVGPGAVGALALAISLLLVAFPVLSMVRREVTLGRWRLALPSLGLAVTQIVVSAIDWALAALCLWALLPANVGIGFPSFACLYTVAAVAGVISHVPAGIGVFDAVLLVALPGSGAEPAVAAALVGYRLAYYLLPMIVAAALFAWYQLRGAGEAARERLGVVRDWAHIVVPNLLFVLVFVGGVALLVSGATPSGTGRMARLEPVAPLAVIEVSHFLASLAGLALVLLALGLRRRLDGAYVGTAAMLAVGVVLSLLKGFDWEEALYLAVVLAILLPCRSAFYRRSALLAQHLSPSWLVAIVAVLVATTWLGFFSFREVEYSDELWWEFLADADAPRFLRATAGVLIAAAILGAYQLLRGVRPVAEPASPLAAVGRARSAIERAEAPLANSWLALLGDKRFLFSESGRSFIMYGVRGRSWVALGEPAGLRSERLELLWRFRELCDEWDARPVFYEVPASAMPDLVELGLTFYKIGEQAYVDLPAFGLEGNAFKGLRYTLRKARKEGSAFEVVPPEGVPALLPRLRAISDEWLATRSASEKGFSLGRFDEAYVAGFPVGVVRREGRVVAFANLWTTPDRGEISIDLMRYGPDAPRDVMEHLFVELLLWAKEQGFRRFDLGMAPLSGLENRKLAPLWSRAGALLFQYGEDFYNFEGLRRYKDKFRPAWEPRYLAAPGGLGLPAILADVTFLIGGGVSGVLGRQQPRQPAALGTRAA